MSIKQISVFVENKTGSMSSMTSVLAENGIDMRALSLAETGDFGIVRIIVKDLYKATTVLKDAGYIHSLTDVLGVKIPDVPGGINKVLTILEGAGVNIDYMYAFMGNRETKHAYMIFRVQDVQLAQNSLVDQGIHMITQEDIEKL